jgi:ribosomal protein L30E
MIYVMCNIELMMYAWGYCSFEYLSFRLRSMTRYSNERSQLGTLLAFLLFFYLYSLPIHKNLYKKHKTKSKIKSEKSLSAVEMTRYSNERSQLGTLLAFLLFFYLYSLPIHKNLYKKHKTKSKIKSEKSLSAVEMTRYSNERSQLGTLLGSLLFSYLYALTKNKICIKSTK